MAKLLGMAGGRKARRKVFWFGSAPLSRVTLPFSFSQAVLSFIFSSPLPLNVLNVRKFYHCQHNGLERNVSVKHFDIVC
jgi:hypothetical protein